MKKQPDEFVITDHIPLVTMIAWQFWKKCHPAIRSAMGVHDLIGDCLLHLLTVRHRYRKQQGSHSTFVYTVTLNKCREALSKASAKKRTGVLINIELLGLAVDKQQPTNDYVAGKEGIEFLLEICSDELRRAISLVLSGEKLSAKDIRTVQPEAKRLVKQYRLPVNDMVRISSTAP